MQTVNPALLTFLINAAWQIPVVTGTVWLIAWSLRHGPASHLRALWIAAMVASLSLPLASIPANQRPVPKSLLISAPARFELDSKSTALTKTPTQLHVGKPFQPRRVTVKQWTAMILLNGYLLFFLFRFSQFVRAAIKTAQIRRNSQSRQLPVAVQQIWKRTTAAFGVKNEAELRVSAEIGSPLTIGIWKKIIVLPTSLIESDAIESQFDQNLTTAIGHEMAHVARHDFAWNIFCELLWLPISFHPASALIRRKIQCTRELACDELVTQRLMDRESYAQSLVHIAAAMSSLPQPGYALGVFDGNVLQERIERLMKPQIENLRRARLLLATGFSAVVLSIVVASGFAISARAQSAAMPEMKIAENAYNGGDFQEAVNHFKKAVNIDPDNINARLFLANALLGA